MKYILMFAFCVLCVGAGGCTNDPLLDSLGLSRCACPPKGHCINCKCGGNDRLKLPNPPAAPDPTPPIEPDRPRRPCPGPGPCPRCILGLAH